MPQNIHILEQSVIAKIAAGEVVERPASVVKELVENAIDAGCNRVRIEISNGGQEIIRVSDDGSGMSREDALLAFERYATSKIFSAEDLADVMTLGFRGEALSSIAAVSIMELSTRDQESAVGTVVHMKGGQVQGIEEVGKSVGTSVNVRRLFYNTPARRKFLRSSQTEFRRIVDIITQLAVAHRRVAFQLSHNNREIFNLPPAEDLKDRLIPLWPKEVVEDLACFSQSGPRINIEGCIGTPQTSRNNRNHQLFILNGRPVVDKNLSHGLFQAYQTVFPPDRHPVAVILITMDASLVDVNVHPTKREVRFQDARAIHDLMAFSAAKALSHIFPQNELRDHIGAPRETKRDLSLRDDSRRYTSQSSGQQFSQVSLFEAHRQLVSVESLGQMGSTTELVSLWQLHNLYIFAAIKSGVVVIDQHAAHERVLYEQAKRSFKESPPTSQQLLFPQVVELTQSQLQLLDEHQDLLAKLGFSVRPFGGKTVLLEAEPATLKSPSQGQILRDILDDLAVGQPAELDREERLARSFACQAAVKAGQSLTQEKMNSLVNMLFATSAPYTCPHGRPTIIRMSLEELARKFGR